MKLVGKATIEETNEIKSIYMRKMALIDLTKSLKNSDDIYEKVILDLSQTNEKFENWWREISEKYNLEGKNTDNNWTINFETREIYLCD